jgi:hypothetical protein
LSAAKSCLTADTSVLSFVTVMVVLAPLRAVIFATTGLTMTASVSQLLRNLPHTTQLLFQGFDGVHSDVGSGLSGRGNWPCAR